jgi:hypothetical protein
VEKVFKGSVKDIETISVRRSDCDPEFTKMGEKYFVYKDPDRYSNVLNLSSPLDLAKADLEYAETVSKRRKPTFTISGLVSELNPDQIRRSYVEFETGGIKRRVWLGKNGTFKYDTTEQGTYTVRAVIAFDGKIVAKTIGDFGEVYFGPQKGSVVYSLEFKPNGCDYREIRPF